VVSEIRFLDVVCEQYRMLRATWLLLIDQIGWSGRWEWKICYIVKISMFPLEGDDAKPNDMTDDGLKKLDRKASGFIRQWFDDTVFHHVSTKSTSCSI